MYEFNVEGDAPNKDNWLKVTKFHALHLALVEQPGIRGVEILAVYEVVDGQLNRSIASKVACLLGPSTRAVHVPLKLYLVFVTPSTFKRRRACARCRTFDFDGGWREA